MTPAARRLILFVFGVFLSVGILECVERANVGIFEATSHRVLAKLTLFEKSPQVGLLFFGTSRTEGGISPILVQQAIKEIAPEIGDISGYNAAYSGSTIATWTSVGPRFAIHPGLRLVVVELSAPQVANVEPVATWEELRSSPATVEGRLAESLQSIFFVRYRSALSRLPGFLSYTWSLALLQTSSPDLANNNQPVPAVILPVAKKNPDAGFDLTFWKPEIFTPASVSQVLDATNEGYAKELIVLVQRFRDLGVKVVFSVPPLTRGYLKIAPENAMRPLFSEVARRTGCEVWNFNAVSQLDSFFHDQAHLNEIGRAHYSRALAIQMVRLLKEK